MIPRYRSPVRIALSVAVAGQVVAVLGQTRTDGDGAKAAFLAAYDAHPAFVLRSRSSHVVDMTSGLEYDERLRRVPGVGPWAHPISGVELFRLEAITTYVDGEAYRVESHRLIHGGDPARSTAVTVWNSQHTASIERPSDRLAQLRHVKPERFTDVRTHYANKIYAYTRDRADLCFAALVAYFRMVFEEADDIAVLPPAPTDPLASVRITSPSVGLTIVVEPTSGVLLAAEEKQFFHDEIARWEWRGELPGACFPAHHPVMQIHSASLPAPNGERTVRYGDVVEFESIEFTRPEPAWMVWTSLAPRAFDRVAKVVINPDGTTDEAATALQRQQQDMAGATPAPRVNADRRLESPSHGISMNQTLVLLAAAAGVLAVAAWVRRRAG